MATRANIPISVKDRAQEWKSQRDEKVKNAEKEARATLRAEFTNCVRAEVQEALEIGVEFYYVEGQPTWQQEPQAYGTLKLGKKTCQIWTATGIWRLHVPGPEGETVLRYVVECGDLQNELVSLYYDENGWE